MADTYDPKLFVISYGGKTINKGIAEGTFMTVTRTNRTRSLRGGADGGQTIVVNNDRGTTVELTYRASSQTNDILEDIRELEDATPAIYEVGTLLIKDLSGRTFIQDENAFIDGPPDVEGSMDEPSRVWRWMLPDPRIVVRGSLAAPRIGTPSV